MDVFYLNVTWPAFDGKCTPCKFNSSPLKNGGWKTTFLLRFGNFSGENSLLNFGVGIRMLLRSERSDHGGEFVGKRVEVGYDLSAVLVDDGPIPKDAFQRLWQSAPADKKVPKICQLTGLMAWVLPQK